MSEAEKQEFETDLDDVVKDDVVKENDVAVLAERRKRHVWFGPNTSRSLMLRSFVGLFLIAASFVALPHTWAEDSREGVLAYKYRDTVMQAIGGHMGAVTVIMRAKSHQDDLALHAKSIADLAKLVPAIFPAGSAVTRSEALSAIWEEPDRFSEAVERLIAASDALHQAVQTETGVRNAFTDLGRTCESCHDKFRE